MPRARFRGSLQGYLIGRAAVLGLLLVLAAVFQVKRGDFPVPFQWFFGITACAFGFTLVSASVIRARRPPALLLPLQPMWDVVYATVLVYISGGALSPFVTLYPLAIIGSAILLSRSGALLVASVSSVAYGLLVDLQYYRILNPLNPFPFSEPEGRDVALQLLFNLLAFYAVALLSGHLAEELRRTGERLRLAEAEVLDLEYLKDSILRSLASGLVALDRSGQEVFHNGAAEELLRRAGVDLSSDASLASVFDLSGGDRREVSFDGGATVLGYTVSPLFDHGQHPRGSILIFQDLTQVKRLEEELRRADRLAAVGRLAAGLAHEIRNPLASLAGSVEVLQGTLARGDEGKQLFEIVLREAERLNRLVSDFLHYARPDAARRSELDLKGFVDEVGFFILHGEGRDRLAIENRVPDGVRVTADREQLEQLFLNLLRNSLEACQGTVRVVVDGHGETGWTCFSFEDDGPGMPSHIAQRVFEPFVTYKPGGTGLGLATVHRIVENHEGAVQLETHEGGGTAFRFRFPEAGGSRAGGPPLRGVEA